MTGDLEVASRVERVRDGEFRTTIPDGWQQGRGAFGGLTIAAMVRAVETFAETPDRSLRSLTVSLPGPALIGEHTIRVENLRVGSGQSTLAARMSQGDEVSGTCTAVLGRPRASNHAEFRELEPPAIKPWRELKPLTMTGGPTFTQFFEYRFADYIPFAGGPSARTLGWVRPKQCGAALSGAAFLAAMSDTWWPTTFTRATERMFVATVAFTLQVVAGTERIDPSVPLAFRGHGWVLHEGYCVEQRELWTEDGQLLALNQQTFAIIK